MFAPPAPSSAPGGRDALGAVVKFTVPVVAEGNVFVGTGSALVVYGRLPAAAASAAFSAQSSDGSIVLSWSASSLAATVVEPTSDVFVN